MFASPVFPTPAEAAAAAHKPMTKAQVCARLELSPRTLEMAVKRGAFPPPVRIGKRAYWSRKSVDAWRDALFRTQEQWQPDL